MTTLIGSGTLFSEWHEIVKALLPADPSSHSVSAKLSTLAQAICRQQFSEANELDWKSFSPEEKYTEEAQQLLSSIENGPLFTWMDDNNSLYLNFWKDTAKDANFILFYTSPESELSNYINSPQFDLSHIEKIINAWVIRIRAMLTFFMNNRDRCLLVNVQTANSANGLFLEALNKQIGLDLEVKSGPSPLPNKNSALIEYLATTLLLKNQDVSELYDEVRSAATLISDQDKSISGIEDRNKTLISAFLTEVTAYKQLYDAQPKLEDEISLNKLQIDQIQEELECYFKKSTEQGKITNTLADYLSNDPLLRIARQVRQMQ